MVCMCVYVRIVFLYCIFVFAHGEIPEDWIISIFFQVLQGGPTPNELAMSALLQDPTYPLPTIHYPLSICPPRSI